MSFINKKPRPKHKLSPAQENQLIKIIFILLVAAFLWILFAPGSGVVTLLGKRTELKKLQQETAEVEQQIEVLQKDIDRLQNDPAYLEDIARREYDLLKRNEKVYDFSPPKNKNNEEK
jgi:cell division protein FtsB